MPALKNLYVQRPGTLVGRGVPGTKHDSAPIGTFYVDDYAVEGDLVWIKTSHPEDEPVWRVFATTDGPISGGATSLREDPNDPDTYLIGA